MYRDYVYYHQSDLIESTRYDHAAHELEINFKNKTSKIFKNVPSEKVIELEEYIDKDGAGDYYRDHIKDIFERKA